MECFKSNTEYVYPFHPIMLLEDELPIETRANGLYSRLHRRPDVLAITAILFH
jgi:hypothetical protein